MLVIGIIGPKASGKETVAHYIERNYEAKAHAHSEILEDILNILHIPNTRMNLIRLVMLRKTFGPEILSHALAKKISTENAPVEVITGVRFQSEIDHIRSYPNNLLIYVDAPIEQRYNWQLKRFQKSDDAGMTFQEFSRQEEEETESGIKALGASADIKIDNIGTEAELFAKIDAAVKKHL